MSAPSRQFLVQQSVLNAVPKCWPAATAHYGVHGALKAMGCDMHAIFVEALEPHVRAEYRALSSRYEGVN